MIPAKVLPSQLPKTHFNIIYRVHLPTESGRFVTDFPIKILYVFLVSQYCHMSGPFYHSWFHHFVTLAGACAFRIILSLQRVLNTMRDILFSGKLLLFIMNQFKIIVEICSHVNFQPGGIY